MKLRLDGRKWYRSASLQTRGLSHRDSFRGNSGGLIRNFQIEQFGRTYESVASVLPAELREEYVTGSSIDAGDEGPGIGVSSSKPEDDPPFGHVPLGIIVREDAQVPVADGEAGIWPEVEGDAEPRLDSGIPCVLGIAE